MARSAGAREIADELNISEGTVRYRINRCKEKFRVLTMDELWGEVYASGLIHFLSLPLEPNIQKLDRESLLKLDPGTTTPPT